MGVAGDSPNFTLVKPIVNAWTKWSKVVFLNTERWPKSCCSQPHCAFKIKLFYPLFNGKQQQEAQRSFTSSMGKIDFQFGNLEIISIEI